MAACEECHRLKVKCDKQTPSCGRCLRLGRVCVPHVSRQGKRQGGPSSKGRGTKRSRKDAATTAAATAADGRSGKDKKASTTSTPHDKIVCEQPIEDTHIMKSLGIRRANHYGLRWMLRSWVSTAFRRRSFGLLGRAGDMAVQSGISMDSIFNASDQQLGMDFLHPILLHPQQKVVDNPLALSELPQISLELYQCQYNLNERWIWVREMTKGMSRWWVTPAFERDICTRLDMEEVYKSNNKGAVVGIFLPDPKERKKHTHAFACLVSRFTTQAVPPTLHRYPDVHLQTKNNGVILVDQISCLVIVNPDQAFYHVEFVPKIVTDDNSSTSSTTVVSNCVANTVVSNPTLHNLGLGNVYCTSTKSNNIGSSSSANNGAVVQTTNGRSNSNQKANPRRPTSNGNGGNLIQPFNNYLVPTISNADLLNDEDFNFVLRMLQ